jgi:drug/metabolite transporter (DMT)-like permease
MQAIIFALISYVSWGMGIFFETVAARRIDSYSFTFWGLLIGTILSSLYVPFALTLVQNFTLPLIFLNLFLALFFIGGTIIYYEALKYENRSLVGTVASAFPVFIVIFSLIFFQEEIGLLQFLAIGITLVGLILSMLDFKEILHRKNVINKGVIFALIASVSWAIYFTFVKLLIDKVGWFWPNYIVFLMFPLVFLYMKFKKIHLQIPKAGNIILPVIISTVLVRIAEWSYNFAITKGMVSVVAPISGANPTLFIVLSFLFLKDPIKKRQIIGIIVTLIGIVTLSLTSG